MTVYKHHDIAIAWLNGKTIQFKSGDVWVDAPSTREAHKMPSLYAEQEYRLKPVTVRYRVWSDTLGVPYIASTLMHAEMAQKLPTFGRWVTEWAEEVL
jgi:hypothetical protein